MALFGFVKDTKLLYQPFIIGKILFYRR